MHLHENEYDLTAGIAGEGFRQLMEEAYANGPAYLHAIRDQYIRQLTNRFEKMDPETAKKYFKGE